MKLGFDLILITLSKTIKQIGILVLSIVLARFLTQTDYGTYLHVQLIANVAIWAFMLGIPHSVYYFLPKTSHKRQFILITLTLMMAIATLVSIGIYLLSTPLQHLLNNPDLESLVIIAAAIAFFQIPVAIFEPTMISIDRVRLFVPFDAFFSIGFFLSILIPALYTSDIQVILQSLCAFYALQMLCVIGVLLKTAYDFHNEHEGEGYLVKDQMKYSLPIGMAEGIFELARYGDKIIVSHFFDPATMAIYARGAMDIPLINILNNTIDNLMMPKLLMAYKDKCAKSLLALWHDSIALTASFMYPSFFFLVFAAPYLIPGLYGEAYKEATIIFQIYSIGILFRVSTYNVIVRVIGKTGIMAKVSAVSEVANILGTIALIYYFGIWGAPAATVISTGIIVFGYLFSISGRLEVSLRAIFPWKRLFRLLLTAAAPVVCLLPIELLQSRGYIQLGNWGMIGLLAPTYTFFYYIFMRFTPALSLEQKELLRLMLPQKAQWLV